MDDRKVLLHAIQYIKMMAEGKNPLTGEEEPNGSALREERVSRCLTYVSGVLEGVADGTAAASPEQSRKAEFSLTKEQAARVQPLETDVSLKELLDHIYTYAENDRMKIIPRTLTRKWLAEEGMLAERDGKTGITSQGKEIGLVWRQPDGFHYEIGFSPAAQQWIIERLPELLAYLHAEKDRPKIDPETGEVLSAGRKSSGKAPFSIPEETLDEIAVLPGGVSVSRFVQYLNSFIDTDRMEKLSRLTLTDWLLEKGYLARQEKNLVPTDRGEAIGIKRERRGDEEKSFIMTVYYEPAQTLLLTHLREITGVKTDSL